jgi:hypothetical protein
MPNQGNPKISKRKNSRWEQKNNNNFPEKWKKIWNSPKLPSFWKE